MTIHFQERRVAPGGVGVGVLSYKRLRGMCRWMGSHDWIDLNRVAFLIELLEWGRTFSDFWVKKVLHIYEPRTRSPKTTAKLI